MIVKEENVTNEHQVRVTSSPSTLGDRPAPIDGPLQAEVISGPGSVADGDHPLQKVLRTGDTAEECRFRVFADVDTSEGIVIVEEEWVLHVTNAMAGSLGTSSQIELKPPAA